MSPKSLLRHKLAVSSLNELAEGAFVDVMDELDGFEPAGVRKIVFCSGKVYYDLLAKRRERGQVDVALIRIEQLYPLPTDAIRSQLARYSQAAEVVWCQEEPENQGSWNFIHSPLARLLHPQQTLTYAGREASASPAAGYLSDHLAQQAELLDKALA